MTSEKEIESAIGLPLQTMLDRRKKVIDDAKAKEEEELAAFAKANPPPPEWAQRRLEEYPTEQELLIALYDTEDKAAIDAKRAAVKAKWPKENTGPIE